MRTLEPKPILISSAVAVALSVFTYCPARAEDQPSFDCTRARTPVEHALCAGGNSDMGWLDQTMDKLYRLSLAHPATRAAALRASQRAWLKQRDSCHGSKDDVSSCVYASYIVRFSSIASLYDVSHITGQYSGDQFNGSLNAVLFPDDTLVGNITSSRGAPSYNSCDIDFHAPLVAGQMHYVDHSSCTVDIAIKGSTLVVKQKGCGDYCGANTDFAGVYSRVLTTPDNK